MVNNDASQKYDYVKKIKRKTASIMKAEYKKSNLKHTASHIAQNSRRYTRLCYDLNSVIN
jgi:hypothetical protein